ncbi:PREDICTED: uncharacterized protein LOC105316587 [Amphimedon queenslandica]|uniref:C3H1-type domain-containing protein n=1 Tax=Amphimedon queenslandica TaxID=400682 RepID=A0A1X7VNB1_AMPQE|nr:PREDICTED: uncharacterized protein LOC105316587 [Amphimedon queenslandica]|eukprot:XP_019864307.1 PREDICTED: uncharacterized protein LOC105316587 [Amphimedon queenslandica]
MAASPPPDGKPSSLLSPLEPDLDYNEEEEEGEENEVKKRCSFSHTHSRLLSEDGELASDEDGEIKEVTPPFGDSCSPRRKFERLSDESLQAGTKQAHNSNICRHFLQGRCLWGDDCRFAHEVPEGEEIGGERSERTRDRDAFHNSPHLSLAPPTLYAVSHKPISIDRIHALYDRVIPSSMYSHMAWATPPSHVKGRAKGLPRPNSREKVEESLGWHRLRTITKGWESEEEEEEEKERRRRGRKRGTDDLRRKLKQERQYTPSSNDSENDDSTDSKLKNRKRIKEKTKEVFDRGDDWFDPWSRKKIKSRENESNSSSSSDEKSSRKLKRK